MHESGKPESRGNNEWKDHAVPFGKNATDACRCAFKKPMTIAAIEPEWY